MNKAFTRETDDAPSPPLEERPISSALNLVTLRGAQLIKEKIAVIEKKHAAEVDPVLKSELRRDLRYWLARQSSMQIVAQNKDTNAVGFGSRVTIQRGTSVMTVTIVGEDESAPKAGLIAWTAPLARAIDGAKVGEKVDLEGGRDETVTILEISGDEDRGG
jgi:transcription elongation GreA/GreB family factor